VHRWFARRSEAAATAAVLLANNPDLAIDRERLASIASAERLTGDALNGRRVLDLCCGACNVAEAAVRLGGVVTAVDNHPIPVLIGRSVLSYGVEYADPDPKSPGIGPRGSWAGLHLEVAEWSRQLLREFEEQAGVFWLCDVDAVLCDVRLTCPSCGAATGPRASLVERQRSTCHVCGGHVPRTSEVAAISPTAELREGSELAVSPETLALLATAEYPPSMVEPDDVFTRGRFGSVPFVRAVSPRQAHLLRASENALRIIRARLADSGYAPQHGASLTTLLALALSGALVDTLTTAATWDRRSLSVRGLTRQEWSFGLEYVELGGDLVASRVRKHVESIQSCLASSPGAANVVPGDMTQLEFADEQFDLVVWDPPFYDNIDYDAVAWPWVRYLRRTVGDLHVTLDWQIGRATSSSAGFEPTQFEALLSSAAGEITRVLTPSGSLGVFWIRRTGQETADLGVMLSGLEAQGLELVQTVRLVTEATKIQHAVEPVFLVFRRSAVVQHADAAQIVEGLHAGRPLMVSGLADLLEKHLDDDELAEVLPAHFKGSRRERLQEAVLTAADPFSIVTQLRRKDLAGFVATQTAGTAELEGLSKHDLASLSLQLLGWQVPRQVGFAVGAVLDECERACSVLRFTAVDDEARGAADTAIVGIESIVRFSVTSWAMIVSGDDWRVVIDRVLGTRSGQNLSFGHWRRALTELPQQLASASEVVGRAGRRLKRAKVEGPLDALVTLRNDLEHQERAPWNETRRRAPEVIATAIARLRAADEQGALPRVLQPASETRDPFGRITLRLVGYGGRSTEFLMTSSSDLKDPIIHFPGDANPREVDPACIPARNVLEAAKLT
jgi:hypothetical protein